MKRLATTFVILAALALVASAALAGPPLPGNYLSTDLGGPLSTGRYTEAWDAGGGAFTANTTQNCGSWNGAALGTEWRYTCGLTTAPSTLLYNTVNAQGNGNKTYMCPFYGGTLWLSGSGPWANGDPDYAGVFDSYVEYETVQYSNWVPISSVTNVQSSAHFNNYPTICMSFQIANGSRVGTTDLGDVFPPNFPALLDPTCATTRTLGAWWNMTSITISIVADCATPIKTSTWGSLKAHYR